MRAKYGARSCTRSGASCAANFRAGCEAGRAANLQAAREPLSHRCILLYAVSLCNTWIQAVSQYNNEKSYVTKLIAILTVLLLS